MNIAFIKKGEEYIGLLFIWPALIFNFSGNDFLFKNRAFGYIYRKNA